MKENTNDFKQPNHNGRHIRCAFILMFDCRGAELLHYASRQCSFGHELYVWIFSHDPSSHSTHRLSLGECHAKEDVLISLSLQGHVNTLHPLPFITLFF